MPPTAAPGAPATWRAKLALLLGASLLALLVAEVALRTVPHAAPLLDLDLYRKTSDGYLRLRPGVRQRHVTRQWDVTVSINHEGWRDHSEQPPDGAKIVLGLGDSFAFGWGVELEDSMLSLLEQQVQQRIPVRLIKAGVPGTGTNDQWEMLRTLWTQYQPDVVLLVFFVGNDFTDVQFGGSRQFDVDDGLLVRRSLTGDNTSARPPSLPGRLVRSSRLLQLLAGTWWQWSRSGAGASSLPSAPPRYWDDWLREFARVHLRDYPETTNRAVQTTLGLLTQMNDFCRRNAAPFILAIVPRSYQIYPDEIQELKAALDLSDEELDLEQPQRILNQWAADAHVPAVDLLPLFRQHQRLQQEPRLYHSPDAHLNREGHRLAATAIQPVLLQALDGTSLDADGVSQ